MHRRRLLWSLAAGFAAGVGLASLQLLLWWHITPSVRPALLASLAWGSWGALWLGGGGFLLWELGSFLQTLGRRGRRPQGTFPFLLGALMVAGVALYNRDVLRQLLPPAHRQALAVVAVFALLWAVAWVLARRRRPLQAALLAVWVFGVWWPWWGVGQQGDQQGGVKTPWVWKAEPTPRRALVVVWEGADLAWLLPQVDGGVMPFLQSLWPRGSWGQLRTVSPFSRAASLVTWATGCSPVRHRVVARRAYRISFLSREPVNLLLRGPWPTPHQLPWRLWERAAPPQPEQPTLWEVLPALGVPTALVGWPFPTRPTAAQVAGPEWVHGETPLLEAEWQRAVMEAVGQDARRRTATLRALGVAAEVGVRAVLLAGDGKTQVLIVHLDLPARLRPLWSGSDSGGVLPLTAQFLDGQLARLWQLFADDQTLLLLLSPYGMAPPSSWDRLLANVGLTGQWPVSPKNSPDGFFFLYGRGVASGVRVRGGRTADLVPTLMYLLDLPVAKSLSGRVLLAAVDERWAANVPLRLVPAYPTPAP
ncbi:MAG: alkaline phosphatase family protein [Thermoanaerobaculum sp.]|nr:alkaline phosphatase family protein [Thermoanaerobaculum sp.]